MTKFAQSLILFAKLLAKEVSGDFDVAEDVAISISNTTTDYEEAETLLKIAKWESHFNKKVFSCEKISKSGAVTIFQLMVSSKEEKENVCKDIDKATAEALSRIRVGKEWCKKLGFKKESLLEPYVSGKCQEASIKTKSRWGSGKKLMEIEGKLKEEL